MSQCLKGHYTTNDVVLHGPLVCYGGFGQPRCEHLESCLRDNGYKFDKAGRRRKIKNFLNPDDVSICPKCFCMTHTTEGYCGKCKEKKC